MQNKIFATVLFLTSAVSCSSFRPTVLLEAYLDPKTTTTAGYEDINWSYALFNQYASGLTYEFRMDYSNYYINNLLGIGILKDGVFYEFGDWDIVTATYAEATLNSFWTNLINSVLFEREFDRTTTLATTGNRFQIIKRDGATFGTVNLSIIVKSRINYSVNIGSVYQAFRSINYADQYYKYLYFYDPSDNLLQTYLLDQDGTNIIRNYIYDLSTVVTNVKRFDLQIQWVDALPYNAGQSQIYIYEFNIFTQNQEISIPDDATGDRFGFEFVAVEWWNFLGHLQNFAWWIVNKSPVAPVFEFIDTYIVTWISGLIDFITGVFNI